MQRTFKVISDLHLNISTNYQELFIDYNEIDCLILNGNVCDNVYNNLFWEFFTFISKLYKVILYVPGELEFSGINNIKTVNNYLSFQLSYHFKNVFYFGLYNEVVIDNYIFVGTPLFFPSQSASKNCSDTILNGNLRNKYFYKMCDKLNKKLFSVNKDGKKLIVITSLGVYKDFCNEPIPTSRKRVFCNINPSDLNCIDIHRYISSTYLNKVDVFIYGSTQFNYLSNIFVLDGEKLLISNQYKDKFGNTVKNFNINFQLKI